MKTGFWLEVVELAAHELIAERQSAPQLQPGATPQEIGAPDRAALKARFNHFNATRQVIRAFSAGLIVSTILGRCPRLLVIIAPLALRA